MFWGKRGQKQGVSGSENGRLFSFVSAVRFKKTVNLALPQNRPGSATAANPALPSHAAPPARE